jgi:hypothetical protein
VDVLEGGTRYLVTTGRRHDSGRMIGVEKCDDPACLEAVYGSSTPPPRKGEGARLVKGIRGKGQFTCPV